MRNRTGFVILLGIALGTGCSQYDPSQAKLTQPQLGAPPTLELIGPDTVIVRDSVPVELRIVPGDYPYSQYSLDIPAGEILSRRTVQQNATLVEVEAVVRFSTRGTHWAFANAWDTEGQKASDSTGIVVR